MAEAVANSDGADDHGADGHAPDRCATDIGTADSGADDRDGTARRAADLAAADRRAALRRLDEVFGTTAESSSDERDPGRGGSGLGEEWYRLNRPPHHGG